MDEQRLSRATSVELMKIRWQMNANAMSLLLEHSLLYLSIKSYGHKKSGTKIMTISYVFWAQNGFSRISTSHVSSEDYISKCPGSKCPGSKRPAQRVPKKRVPKQLWHIFSLSRAIFKASRRGRFECTQVQNVHESRYSYEGMGPYEMYTNRAAQPERVSPGAYHPPWHSVARAYCLGAKCHPGQSVFGA